MNNIENSVAIIGVAGRSGPVDLDRFDAGFFGINHREAELLDPQQRVFLEACWEALEDAGYEPGTVVGLTAVFAGQPTSTYLLFNLLPALLPSLTAEMDPLQLLVGNAADSLATRVSYKLNLKGPSFTVQSPGSTLALAVHLARQSLLNGECDLALAGSVSVDVRSLADGEAGVFVLKRAEEALRDGDNVQALVMASEVDGPDVRLSLEPAPKVARVPVARDRYVLPVSARTGAALETACQRLADWLEEHPELDLADVEHTLTVGRRVFEHGRVVECGTREEAVEALRGPSPPSPLPVHPSTPSPGEGRPHTPKRRFESKSPPLPGRGTRADRERGSGGEGLRRRVSLPTYPFERRRYWIDPPSSGIEPTQSFHTRPSLFNPYEPPRDEAEEKVAIIWQEVLGVAPVGAHDDFFQLGGHSLLAPQILARVRDVFKVDFPLQHVFSFPTPAELAEAIRFIQEDQGPPPIPHSSLRETGGPYPLSFSQERLWFIDRLDPENPIYNEPRAARVTGDLDVLALERSLRELVRRQETLRTTYVEVGGEPVQQVSPEGPLFLPEVDLSGLPEPLRRAEERRRTAEEARRPFNLSAGPPLRTALLRLDRREHVVLFTVHHIASDGWSLDLLVNEVAALYSAFSRGLPSPLPEPAVQYADFAAWQKDLLRGEVLETQVDYWSRELDGAPLMLELPTDRPRPPVQSFRGATTEAAGLSPEAVARLEEVGRQAGAGRFMTLLALFLSLLRRLSGQEDVLTGSPIANRTRPEIEGLVGFFVNLLVLRGRFAGSPSFEELLAQVRDTCLRAYAHQDLPFDRLVEALRPERDLSRTPIFQALFVLQNAPLDQVELPGLTLAASPVEAGVARYELTLAIAESPESPDMGLLLRLEYATDLFDPATAARFVGAFRVLSEAAAAAPERRVAELPMLSEAERRQVVEEWNRTGRPRLEGATFIDLFAAQVERSPESVAAVCAGRSLTYAELDRRTQIWARLLAARGVGPESLVAILSPRGLDFLTAVLAVFQAGGAYLPLDPSQPTARIEAVLRQSGARWLLSGGGLGRGLDLDAELLEMEELEGLDQGPLPPGAGPESLAYVIFTSGSTGLPKGVMIHHRGMLNHLLAKVEDLELAAGDAVAQNASQSFDISVWQLLCALLVGGRVHVYPDDVARDPAALLAAAQRDGLTILEVVPSLLAAMLDVRDRPPLERLRWMIVTGEALPPELCRRWLALHPDIPLLNAYGPTECSDDVSHHVLRQPPELRVAHTPIGRALANTRLYIVNPELEPQPAGVPGELVAGGTGVGRGYLGRPELTAERFVPDSFGSPGERLYRTGDLCRFLADGHVGDIGEIEYLGRIDHQVKVRGFRIELGEIEAALCRHPEVREAVVLAHGAGADKRLVAYVAPPVKDDLRLFLRDSLPEAMVPSAFVFLGSMPLTPNGKVDRKALAKIEPELRESASATSAGPRTRAEEVVAGIWRDLLKIERVGVEDSFFDLGGHSLMGTRVLSRVRDALGVEVPLRALFEAPTLEAFAARIEDAAPPIFEAVDATILEPGEREGARPLSFGQERLWLLDRLAPGDPSYNILGFLRLVGPLSHPALERSLDEIVRRHEVLRTRLPELDGQPVRIVSPPEASGASGASGAGGAGSLPVVDLGGLSEAERDRESRRILAAETLHGFDLARGPLLRTALIRLDAEHAVLLVNMHHIVSDGWSLGVLVDEAAALYDAFHDGLSSPLPELPLQYADHAAWQRRWLSGPRLEAQIAWWRDELAQAPPPPTLLELPTDRPRPPVRRARGARERVALGPDLTVAIQALANTQGATPFMVLLAAFQTLLHRYSGQDDVLVGSPVANRGRTEVEGLIGFFVNTLVLRGRFHEPGLRFRGLLERTRATVLGAYAHQDLPFERLVEELRVERSLSHTPLFQVMLALQNVPATSLRLRHLTLEPIEIDGATAKFDLNAELVEDENGLGGTLEYDSDLFDRDTVRRMIGHFRTLLQAAVERPEDPVDRLPLLTGPEQAELAAWNRTAEDYPDVCLHELIEAQVKRTPDAVAVMFEEETLTYRELDERASALAAELPAELIGISVERSLEMIVGLVAILKAGGAYVPIDPGYPAERVAYMVEDSGVSVLLDAAWIDHWERRRPAGTNQGVSRRDAGAPSISYQAPDQAAYMIYTSGSTGRPKGALNAHRGIVNRILWMQRQYGLTPEDRVLQKTPFSFDVSVWELFWPLITGARLVVARPGGHQDPAYLVETIRREEITTLHFVPSMLQVFVEQPGVEECVSLRRVMASGEALPAELAKRFFARLPKGVELHNLYGPTEAAVDVTYHACRPGEERVPIGRPVANTRILILDREGQEVPVGIPGELHIAGVQVGRGYLGRPDLTADRFVPDQRPGEGGARMYRTGDLARWLPDGEIEYLGRIDHQVKIRGFRIELGEIEAALARHPAVREAVVLARDQSLAAYIVSSPSSPGEGLRAFLAESLPEHMLPSAFVFLDAMPLTPNGKVDRKALAGIEPERRESDFVAPRNAAEEILAGIWRDLLGVPRVGVTDRFFELGGHSLLGMRVAARVQDAFGVELPLRTLFEAPTVEALAARIGIASGRGDAPPPIRPLSRESRDGDLPLSFAQERLWFLDRLQPDSPFYNISGALHLTGDLKVDVLQAAFAEIARRHESLRTTFPASKGVPVQRIVPEADLRLPVTDLSGMPEEEARRLVAEISSLPFDLERGPLLRLALLRLGAEDWVLLFAMHHIVSDGWSLGVLVEEGGALYKAFLEDRPSPLPPLAVQYADFAAWQREWLRGAVLDRQLAWWKAELAGAPTRLELPTDRPRPRVQTFRGAVRRIALAPALAGSLAALAAREGASLFMVLLASFQALLLRFSGQEDFLVGSPIAGRGRTELEPLIGFFVNTLALRGRSAADGPFRELLARVRSSTLGAFAHADVPFERLVEELEVERSLAWNPLVQVTFALQNVPGGALELPGLTLAPVDVEWTAAKFDLSLALAEQPGGSIAGIAGIAGIEGTIEYAADLFDAATVDRFAGCFRTLLEGVATGDSRPLAELPILSGAEARQVVTDWNRTRTDFPREACIHELFDEQAARTPEAVAAVFGAEICTYRDLQARANRLAHHLIGLGVQPGEPVGIRLERSLDMVVATLAVLKAGGAYVPLDVAYPEERLAFMLEDAGARVVIRSADCDPDLLETRSDRNPEVFAAPESLAYLVYTSGSTGRPKGVAVPHRAVVRLVRETDYIDIRPDDVLAQASNTSFDAATFEIWGALLNGARMVGVSKETLLSPRELAEQIRRDGITALFLTTAVFSQVGREEPGAFRPLRHLLFGGEAVDSARVRQVLKDGGPERLLHVYGPTESTTFASWHLVEQVPEGAATVPIGMPLANTTLLVFDRGLHPGLHPTPAGVSGELYIGGEGLAWGYLNQPDLTAERFVPDPFSAEGGRLYRTGDLVRRRAADGAVEFLGRADFQVKIRGFRIEPGEIEAALLAHPGVRDAVVLVLGEGNDKRLAAYVAGDAPVAELKAHLAERLPPFMIPSGWVVLDSLPLNPNGKVDRKVLTRIEPDTEETTAAFAPPHTVTEELLAGAWSEVLGVERVGASDDFFELGGHSLLATRLVSRVRDLFQVELPLRALFETSVLSGLAEQIDLLRQGGGELLPPPILRGAPGDNVEGPLSFAQERLWFLERLDPGTPFYNVPFALRIISDRGNLDVGRLAAAFRQIVRRHEALRTTFGRLDGRPWQRVSPSTDLPVPEIDLTGLPVERRETEAARRLREEAFRPFDLERGPLLRVLLVRLGAEERWAFLNVHHLVSDGWSIGVLVRELGALYSGGDLGTGLPELPIQYLDFAAWQRAWLGDEVLQAHIRYWRDRLRGARTVLELPADRPRPPVQTFRGTVRPLELPAALVRGLEALGRRRGATLFMTLLAAWQTVLYRYTGQDDLLVGSPVAGRGRRELEGLIGLFVNTVVLRGELSGPDGGEITFGDLLERTRTTALGAFAHQELPFERLVDELRVERSLARHPVFQAVFALNNTPWEGLSLPGVTLEPLAVESGTTKVDLLLSLSEGPDGLAGGWEYSTDLFDTSTVDRMTGHLRTLLEGAAADPARRLSDLPILTESESHQALREWNDTAEPFEPIRLDQLFAAAAARFPNHDAVVFEDARITYAGLAARAERLAERLRSLGAGPEERVGICADEGIERIVAVLAVFRAGGAYLPLDPSHPPDRLAWMLEDARVRVLLVQGSLLDVLPETEAVVLDLDREASVAFGPHPPAPSPGPPKHTLPGEGETCFSWVRGGAPLPGRVGSGGPGEGSGVRASDHLAYIIYTSGSTGRPNGVPVEHRSAAHLIRQAVRHFQVDAASRVLQSVSFSFDASVLETWMALSTGATLVLCSRETRMSGPALAGLIRAEAITHAVLTPSVLGVLPEDDLPTLRTASVGGDSCPAELAARWSPPRRAMRLLNCYGPTETTIYAVLKECRGPFRREPPIGRPIGNTRAFVVDPAGRLLPAGVPGELWLGGEGLARGYLNRPDLTADRFRPDPFAVPGDKRGHEGARLYRTGDLVRLLPGGEMEFLGRADGQVKIRGLRIELGEIEAALGRHPAVAECAVLALGQGADRRLAAFVVARPEGEGALVSQLREHLHLTLPDYMVPASFLFLEAMPLTPVGKVDRRALTAMDFVPDAEAGRVEARDVLELELARIWEEVLNRPRIGVRDNFFDLGGHSLLAVRLLARVQQRFGRDLPLAVLFQEGTVERMAALLRDEADGGRASCLIPIQPGGSATPFFCVHPAGGDVLCYATLARHLGADQPFYGLQARGLSGEGEPLETLADMAALYVDEIRFVQPEGPYRLGGWSLGGLVAFEMARRLRDLGEDVSLLAILDSSPRVAGIGGIGGIGEAAADDVDLLLDIVAYVASLWNKDIGLRREDLEGLDREEQLSRTLDVLRAADFLPPGAGLDQLRRALAVYRASSRAVRDYEPRTCPGGAVLFRAAGVGEAPLDDLGWGGLLGGPLEIEAVPGQHLTILAEPNVATLAERMRSYLREVPAREPSPARLG